MDLAALARSLRLPKATAPSRSSTFKSFLAATRSSKDFLELKGNSFELFGTQRGVKPPNNKLKAYSASFTTRSGCHAGLGEICKRWKAAFKPPSLQRIMRLVLGPTWAALALQTAKVDSSPKGYPGPYRLAA